VMACAGGAAARNGVAETSGKAVANFRIVRLDRCRVAISRILTLRSCRRKSKLGALHRLDLYNARHGLYRTGNLR